MAMSAEDLREIGLWDYIGWQHAYARPTPAVSSAAAPPPPAQAAANPSAASEPPAPFKELPPEVVAKMSKNERKEYHAKRIAAEKAAKASTAGAGGEAPKVLTKAERRVIQEAHRLAKQQAKDSSAGKEEALAELKMQGLSDEQARQMLAEMEKEGAFDGDEDEDDEEDAEDLMGCVRRYLVDKKSAGEDAEPLHQFQMRVRFQGFSESLPMDHLQCVVRALSGDGCKACDLEVPKLQPSGVAKKVAPIVQKWAGLMDALYTRAGDCLDAVNALVSSVSEGVLDVCDQASDRVKDTAFVGIIMALREELESVEDGDLLAGLTRLDDKGPVLQKYIDFLEAELEDEDEDGQVNSAPKSSIPFAAVTPEVASAHPVDTRETAAQGMNVAPMQGGDTAGQNYEVKQKEWEITLKREKRGELVGLVLEQAYDFMCVRQQPQKGLAKAWNTSNPSLAIRPGDILQEVNGICGIGDDVLKQLKASDEMKIKIRRFLMFKVSVPVNAEETLGLHLSTTPEGEVAVAEVHANGAVKKYNMTCGAGTEILAGDIIVVCVGFNSTSAQELRTHLAKVSGTTELWIRRPN